MVPNRNTSSITLALACLFLVAGLMSSCASLGSNKQEKQRETLKATVEAFNSSFRWEDYKSASVFINPDKKELFWTEVDKFKRKIHLVEFQIRDIDWNEKTPVATAILYFQYYRTDAPTLVSVSFSQKWYYSEKDNCWRLGQSGYQAITKDKEGI
jgi:hypothetical protein